MNHHRHYCLLILKTISDLLLVTCGSHAASRAPDRFLMVYDLRMLRAISPIQISIVPSQLRFLPSMSSRIVVLSSLGQVQLVETAALSTPSMSMFQVSIMQCT